MVLDAAARGNTAFTPLRLVAGGGVLKEKLENGFGFVEEFSTPFGFIVSSGVLPNASCCCCCGCCC